MTRKACAHVKYDECEDLPRERCRNITLKEPFQERIHREKCLLPSPDLQPDINALDNDSSFPLGLAVLKRVNNKVVKVRITRKVRLLL